MIRAVPSNSYYERDSCLNANPHWINEKFISECCDAENGWTHIAMTTGWTYYVKMPVASVLSLMEKK